MRRPLSVTNSLTTRRSPASLRRSTYPSRTSVFTTDVSVPGDDQPRAATSLDLSPSPASSTRSTPSPAGLIRSPACASVPAGGPSDGSPQNHPAWPCPGPHFAAAASSGPATSASLTPLVFTSNYFH